MKPDVHGGGRSDERPVGVARGLIPDWLDDRFTRSVTPVIRKLIIARVNPNAITVMAFALTACGGVLIAFGHLIGAFVLIVVGGVLDFCDGKVAALTGRVTRAGAVLDSSLDRYSDSVVYLALVVYFAVRSHPATALAAVLALIGSMMTSYMMALGKSHGINFRIGVLRRQDRVTLISFGLLFTPLHGLIESAVMAVGGRIGLSIDTVPIMPLAAVVYLLAVLSNVTALQRMRTLLKVADRDVTQPVSRDEEDVPLRERQLAMLEREIGTVDR
jgi:CDP-diacylglycerol--glycerol-3-phosphate 3-phosphatidyltransferase